MTTKYSVVAALASVVALTAVGPASATGSYYEGIDPNSPRRTTHAVPKADGHATTSIRSSEATYAFPTSGSRGTPRVVKGGEGAYYPGISLR